MIAVHIQTDGMHCEKCPPRIEHALESVPGVMAARAYRLMGLTSVLYDPAVVDAESLETTITEAGFRPTHIVGSKAQ